MILSITLTGSAATDLGFLLHKNPGRLHSAEMAFGKVHVFYPEATEERCTACLMLDVDPVGLVRGRGTGVGLMSQYVNDRPYAASSLLSSAMTEMYSTAMSGRSKERQELADRPLQLEASVPVVACRGGDLFLRRLFEPLGYTVTAERLPLDDRFPEWGESNYFRLTLAAEVRLADLLRHLYVLIPAMDEEKHYWVGAEEIDKLLRRGEGWLSDHPLKEEIAQRFLKQQRSLAREALARLAEIDGTTEPEDAQSDIDQAEEAVERPLSLHEVRLNTVLGALKGLGAKRVADLGCGEGRLLNLLIKDRFFEEILGMDVSLRCLERAASRLRLEQRPASFAKRIQLIHGSLVYRDKRLAGYDAAALVEVIEHLDAARLTALERVVFEFARPRAVVLTTPNSEYNVLFEGLAEGTLRHSDHRFEWTRFEFAEWCARVGERFGYTWRILPVGPEDPTHGAPSQMALFELEVTA